MGIDGKEDSGPTWLQAQLAAVIAGAIQNAFLLQARPEGLGDIGVNGVALVAAADMTEQFDIFAKGELSEEIEDLPGVGLSRRYVSGWGPWKRAGQVNSGIRRQTAVCGECSSIWHLASGIALHHIDDVRKDKIEAGICPFDGTEMTVLSGWK